MRRLLLRLPVHRAARIRFEPAGDPGGSRVILAVRRRVGRRDTERDADLAAEAEVVAHGRGGHQQLAVGGGHDRREQPGEDEPVRPARRQELPEEEPRVREHGAGGVRPHERRARLYEPRPDFANHHSDQRPGIGMRVAHLKRGLGQPSNHVGRLGQLARSLEFTIGVKQN